MKKTLAILQLALMLVGAQTTSVLALGHPDQGPGCGLGKLAWQDFKGQKQIAPQVMMATTNGTFGSQTFGISFGTSGCTNDGVIMRTERANAFASLMYENLAQEMAQGQGEHLASLATLLGIPAEQQAEFFALTREKYVTLIQAGESEPVAMLAALNDAVATHQVLARLSVAR